jgi:UDP-sulfoquinovose synthase
MRILILGGDGYLGWPTAMHFASLNDDVFVIDNYLRREIADETDSEALFKNPTLDQRVEIFAAKSGKNISYAIGDCCDRTFLDQIFKEFEPDTVIHYAEQPSAPYSMKNYESAKLTLDNNLGTTFSLIWAVINNNPDCHIVKLGTMGEYGTPNIDIEEGWLDVEHNGRSHSFLYPRQGSSLYHTTKVLDTDLLWFYVRTYGIRVTDLMQGPVYGLATDQTDLDDRLQPHFHYDDIFGTVVNRFIVQALAGVPLTVYGKGNQTRGYLNLRDTLQCVDLSTKNPAKNGELRIFNQLTELLSVNEIANKVAEAARELGIDVSVQSINNPRKELEDHYYNVKHQGLLELGLRPNFMTKDVLVDMIERVSKYKSDIDTDKILPRVSWS